MNRPIRRVAVVVMVLFALLLGNITFSAVVRENGLNNHPNNRRVRDAEFGQDRGAILVGNEPVADTAPSDDRFKYQRSYPQGELYAPITGYYSYDHGSIGLEATFNGQLAGTDDSLVVRRLIDIVTNKPPTGAMVETTVNAEAQQAAYRGLDGRKGAVVALDAKTGAVLALVSTPSYDPNRIASHEIGDAEDAYQELANSEDEPLSNRAVREAYPPGSTFKLVTAAAALENGVPADQLWDSPARLKLPGTETYLPNESPCGGEKIDLEQALKVSCNTAFANVGISLGADKMREQAEKFGFASRQLPDLNGAASRFPDNPNDAQLGLSAIGQFDVAATPLQIAMVSAAIANDGVLMQPYLVDSVRGQDLSPISTTRPRELGQAMSEENARILQGWMQTVVNDGTGRNAQISGMEIGGKTGTANTTPEAPPYAWFTSYGRSTDRTVAVAVFIEEAPEARDDISGGRLAAPIARSVMQELL
ncbi:peptidoglycan D,D-transpeptidase FtsI family protein [Propionibacteriaceae bacterium Y1700]|uniref:peptidoglycan D,D-transpeptidase FtsI family protein n=1 Tax=Microlunatus sp. Y1700 TaxID=3418487 RepID=UPI003DA71F45